MQPIIMPHVTHTSATVHLLTQHALIYLFILPHQDQYSKNLLTLFMSFFHRIINKYDLFHFYKILSLFFILCKEMKLLDASFTSEERNDVSDLTPI